MLKGSVLYIVIIISLVIAVLCSFLILAAYFFRGQYMVKSRFDRLQNNLSSGIHILLSSKDTSYLHGKTISLFNTGEDSIKLQTIHWGIYDIGTAEAFQQKDTVFKVWSDAFVIDSTKWAAIYLIDEDRPLSLSGNTNVRGDVYLPKAGVKAAYVDNKAYQGDKRMIIGKTSDSQRKLPALQDARLNILGDLLKAPRPPVRKTWKPDSLTRSFRNTAMVVNLGAVPYTLENMKLTGRILLYADTLLTIDSTTKLDNVLIFAKAILVKSGFRGNCQLFATDSISVEKNCRFIYPSCLGLLRFKSPMIGFPPQISIGANTQFDGGIFTYEKEKSALPATIALAKDTKIRGQVYAQNTLSTKDSVSVAGSVFTSRFIYQSSFTRYENYLINLNIDEKALSRYYLTSDLFPVAKSQRKIMRWLEVK